MAIAQHRHAVANRIDLIQKVRDKHDCHALGAQPVHHREKLRNLAIIQARSGFIEDHQFVGLCRALDREDLIDDPRARDLMTRIQHVRELYTLLEQELRKWRTVEILERARRFGAPMAPVHGVTEFLRDPQVAASGIVVEAEDPDAGAMRFLRQPVRFERTPASLRHRPPRLGEQSDALLYQAGYADHEIAKLRTDGVVR